MLFDLYIRIQKQNQRKITIRDFQTFDDLKQATVPAPAR
jgi:hypothetical protein